MAIEVVLNENVFFRCSELHLICHETTIKLNEKFTKGTRLCNVVRYKFVRSKTWQKQWVPKKRNFQESNPNLISERYEKVVFDRKWLKENVRGKSNLIVLVLESPHVSEYDDYKPLIPANGRTGDKIDKYVQSLFNALIKGGLDEEIDEWFFAIVNPVPWQASLGRFIKGKLQACLRDTVWKKVYTDNYGNCKDYFESIIQSLPENAIIINACTGGKINFEKHTDTSVVDKCPINRFVMESIMNNRCRTHNVFFTNHPSAWGPDKKCELYKANFENNHGVKLEFVENFKNDNTP